MDSDKFYDIKDKLHQVFKESKVSIVEFGKMLVQYGMYFCNESDTVYDDSESEYKYITKEDIADLDKTWESIINSFIQYMHTHENVMKEVVEVQKEKTTYFKDLELVPDITFSVSADGLDESIKAGYWTPATDANISISVGGKEIISRY